MKKPLLILFLIVSALSTSLAQNYTSAANGSWTTGANWAGGASPSLTSQGYGTININHNLVISGNYNLPGGSINLATGKTLTINGDFTVGLGGGGNNINVSGTLNISGNVKLYSNLNILPGGKVIVDGSVTVVNATYLKVGTNVAPPQYADLVIKQNLVSENSGDILIERNGRVAIYGDFVNSGSTGGTKLTVNNGGQVYIDGDINLTGGGGDAIINNNSSSPYGLYVNGTTTNSGGGSTTTPNKGDRNTLESTNPSFFNWVQSQSDSPLPVELLYFNANKITSAVTLTWATASELNFDYFSLERSLNGASFVEIGRVTGSGTTGVRNDYEFLDSQPVIGKLYYRLKSVDFDGYTEYFNIETVDFEQKKTVAVYPNPVVDGVVNFQFNFPVSSGGQIQATDLNGWEVFRHTVNENEFSVPLSLNPGTYLFRINSGDFSEVKRVVVK